MSLLWLVLAPACAKAPPPECRPSAHENCVEASGSGHVASAATTGTGGSSGVAGSGGTAASGAGGASHASASSASSASSAASSSASSSSASSAGSGGGLPAEAYARLAAGWYTTCGVRGDGTLWCWGYNANGQLGDGTTASKVKPVQVSALGTTVAEPLMAASYMCARTVAGALWCSGYNDHGQLGDGTTIEKHAPQQVVALGTSVSAVPEGTDSGCSCVRKVDGSAWCWGDNVFGALGDGTTLDAHTPVQVAGLGTTVAQLSHTVSLGCARKNDGTAWCWGTNQSGGIGDGSGKNQAIPVQVTSLGSSVAQIGTGGCHSCALKTDGTLWCWGCNTWGNLGDGTTTLRQTPVQVTALGTSVAQISVGWYQTCARKLDGTAWCWGHNMYGQLGDGTTVNKHAPVQVIALGKDVAQVSAGAVHTCALKTDGTAWCWGQNQFGALGDGTTVDKLTPTAVIP